MSARVLLLALAVGGVVATTSCSTLVPDSSPGPTLVPLPTTEIDHGTTPSSAPSPADPDDAVATVPSAAPTTSPLTSTTSSTISTTTTSTTTSTSTSTTSTTTVPTSTTAPTSSVGLVSGAKVEVAGRQLNFTAACLDGRNVVLDGITWSFAGNSFRLSGQDDIRSEAELIGDGWTMPMVVAAVQSGVYTYVGTPVAGSVSSAEVVIDHAGLADC